jgi:hypothetical protein
MAFTHLFRIRLSQSLRGASLIQYLHPKPMLFNTPPSALHLHHHTCFTLDSQREETKYTDTFLTLSTFPEKHDSQTAFGLGHVISKVLLNREYHIH